MLDMRTMGEGTEVVKNVIRELGGEKSWYSKKEVTVSASVGGKVIISEGAISVDFYFDGHDHATIRVYWEEGGYPNYGHLGLYGQSDTRYQRVKGRGERTIQVIDETYEITIRY